MRRAVVAVIAVAAGACLLAGLLVGIVALALVGAAWGLVFIAEAMRGKPKPAKPEATHEPPARPAVLDSTALLYDTTNGHLTQ